MKNFIEISDSEEEQVDKLKKWWDSNGKQIIAGAVLGLAGIFGWNAYVDYQDSQALNARALYLSYASDSANVGAYDKLIKDHPSSSYADQGTLVMAKYLFDAGNYSLALDALKPLMSRENSVIASTASLRTASLFLELGQHEEALAVLNMENANGFQVYFITWLVMFIWISVTMSRQEIVTLLQLKTLLIIQAYHNSFRSNLTI
jgi:predicted negative regulator of RcsB-dependent stress response